MKSRHSIQRWFVLIFVALLVAGCPYASASLIWDEQIEGTLPLPAPYILEIPEPGSGVTSVLTDTGDIALRSSDQANYNRHGRINRGNWPDALGYTAHMRLRFGFATVETMSVQLNDGLTGGRMSLRYFSGKLYIRNAVPDAGQPSEFGLAINEWIELWLTQSGQRFTLYRWTGSEWSVASQGAVPAAAGAVFIGSASSNGEGTMEIDFFRLKRNASFAPGDAQAPCANLSAAAGIAQASRWVSPGGSTSITVSPTSRDVIYQLVSSDATVGVPVEGSGGAISLPTGPLVQSSDLIVRATSKTGQGCSVDLPEAVRVLVADPVARISEAKAKQDGEAVSLPPETVSASFGESYWIQEEDRSSGIRVLSGALPYAGARRAVVGALRTSASERQLEVLEDTPSADAPSAPIPLAISSRSVGGGVLSAASPGVEGGTGLNNIGLFARVWGKPESVGTGFYYIDDGSGLSDGAYAGLRVTGWPTDPLPEMAVVSGPVTTYYDPSGKARPAVVSVDEGCTPPSAALSVTAEKSAVCPGSGTNIKVSASQTGVIYQLREGAALQAVGSPVNGTGGTILLPTGPLGETATFDVLATRANSACSVRLNTKRTVTVSPLPKADLHVYALQSPVDLGASTKVCIAMSEIGVNYQLRLNGSLFGVPVTGTGGTVSLSTGALASDTIFAVRALRTSTGCSVDLQKSVSIHVNDPANPQSKVGLHVVCGSRPGYLEFLKKCSDASRPVRMIKCVDDFSPAYEAKQVNTYTLTVGRINEAAGQDLGGLDYRVSGGYTPQQTAAWYYALVKPTWQANPHIDVWEACNEWSWHWAYQADFYIALMDLAEADGFKVALWSCSVGNPPEAYYYDIARACARAAAHGGHMLSLHEYGLWPPPGQQYALLSNAGPDLVTRYRRLYNYLQQQNAVIPLVLTEVGQEGGYDFVGTELFMQDYMWYDSEMKKDPYVVGCAAWILGECGWGGASFAEALPALGDYISSH